MRKWLFLHKVKKVMLLHFNNDGIFDSNNSSRTYSVETGYKSHTITQDVLFPAGTYYIPAKRMYGDASGYFDQAITITQNPVSAPSRIKIPRQDDIFEFGNQPFTIEFWIRQEQSPASVSHTSERTFIDCWNPLVQKGWKINVPANYDPTLGALPTVFKATFKLSDGSSYNFQWNFPSADVRSKNTYDFSPGYINDFRSNNWKHYAITRDSNGVFRVFYHGTMLNESAPSFAAVTTGYTQTLPGVYTGGYLLIGGSHKFYLDDFRITKGEALYAANYTPPTQELT